MDTLSLYLVTWNVATRSPSQDLNSLLDFPSQYNKNKPLPDFYVVGLQEVKSQPQNLLLDTLFTDPWTSALNKILCRQGYVTVKTIRLQGLLLVVYSQLKHVTHLRDIEAQYTKTGFGGTWGNKGAVSIRFSIYGCSVSLVNCHLTAHEHLLADRVADYNTIVNSHTYHVRETSHILFHDYVFWIGDLNFRMDHPTGNSLSSEQIVRALQAIEKDKYTSLMQYDQLTAVMNSGEAFSEFKEPEIKFPPTYKFDIGTDNYDLKRKPSWTDRILFKVVADNYENLTLRADTLSYTHLPHYTVSDHKPVIGLFNIKLRPVSQQPVRIARSAVRMRSAIVRPMSADGQSESFLDAECAGCTEAPSEPTFSNYTVKTVDFSPISKIWYIGDTSFRTQITLSRDVEVNSNDWIGIYDANFQSLDDYIAYEYLAKVSLPESPALNGGARVFTLSFPVGSGVRTPGFYRFIYFSQPNSDVRSVLGVSEPFEVSVKDDKNLSVDPCAKPSADAPSTSKSAPRTPAPHASDNFFADFASLDVANLSRHFSNDLNID